MEQKINSYNSIYKEGFAAIMFHLYHSIVGRDKWDKDNPRIKTGPNKPNY